MILSTKTIFVAEKKQFSKVVKFIPSQKKYSRFIHDFSFVIFNEFSYYIKPLNHKSIATTRWYHSYSHMPVWECLSPDTLFIFATHKNNVRSQQFFCRKRSYNVNFIVLPVTRKSCVGLGMGGGSLSDKGARSRTT